MVIILIDDGSPDNSGNICDEYAKKDVRIKVIHKENSGPSDARNQGLKIATGDYIMYVDSDDYIEKTACEELVAIIKEKNAEIVCFNLKNVKEDTEEIVENKGFYRSENTKSVTMMTYEETMLDNLYRTSIRYEAVSKIYKKEIAQRVKFPVGMLAEDFAIFYKLLRQANTIAFYDRCLYKYVIRKGSTMNVKSSKLYADTYTTEIEVYQIYKQIAKSKEDKIEAERRYFRSLAKIYAKLYQDKEYEQTKIEVEKNLKSISFQYLKLKEKILYTIFCINKSIFVWGMKKVYQRL